MDTGAIVGIALGAASIGVSAGFGLAQLRLSRHTDERTEQLPKEVGDVVVQQLRVVLKQFAERGDETAQASLDLVGVHYADINNDGDTELVVQHPYGAHSSALTVYGWIDKYSHFGQLAELVTAPMNPFTVADVDGDGRLEVATVDADWERGAYVEGHRKEVLYRWDRDGFVQIDEQLLPDDPKKWLLKWATDPIQWDHARSEN
jgi:hypothetical protein